jgi:hypothetical protein
MTLEQAIGTALLLLFLADVFLTVLYARAGTGLLAPSWNRLVWMLFRTVASLFGKHRVAILSLAGPIIVVLLIGFWALGLTLGAALIIRPELGISIRPSNGDTPTDFVTALLVAGNSLSIVGSGDYAPHTTGARLLFLLNSLIGASVLSLVLSYLVQVYSALRERNALALTLDLMTNKTGDAADLLVRLVPRGDSSSTISELGNLVRSLAATKEAHHFYPLLFYFRFKETEYAVSRLSFIALDLVALIETALDDERYASLISSAPVTALRRSALLLLETLDRSFSTVQTRPSEAADAWCDRQSYNTATHKLALSGIRTQPDGLDRFIAARREWKPLVQRVGAALGYKLEEIDQRCHGVGHVGSPKSATL